jgi:YebC/PmpR family DNA-binding regulatory protein
MGRKWNNIKYGKAAKDAERSKIYSKFGREIYVAAKAGDADPEINVGLRNVIEKAKTYKVPREIIDRAIEKAKGNAEENYDAIRYEGYGVNGAAVIVDALTDNVNRTVAEVRTAFNKNGGKLGVSGSVAFLFEPTAIIGFKGKSEDEVLELLVEADTDFNDIEVDEDVVIVYTKPELFHQAQAALQAAGITEFEIAELSEEPISDIAIDAENVPVFEKMLETLEGLDDVQQVYHNGVLPE